MRIPSFIKSGSVIFFGAGDSGAYFVQSSGLDPTLLFDNDTRLHDSEIHGVRVSTPRGPRDNTERVIITSGAASEILDQLISLGWDREKVWVPPKSILGPRTLAASHRRQQLAATLSELSGRLSLPVVLMGGAALGATRQQDFIAWDSDVDCAISDQDWRVMRSTSGLTWDIDARSKIGRLVFDDWSIPISVQLFSPDKATFCDWGLGGEPLRWPIQMFSQPTPVQVRNHKLHVPSPPASYLETVYGKNWHVPNPSFTEIDYPLRQPQSSNPPL